MRFSRLTQLETDPSILLSKAETALERYGHQVVIGNDLNRRKFEVVLVARQSVLKNIDSKKWSEAPGGTGEDKFVQNWIHLREGKTEIEEDIVSELIRYHAGWVNTGKQSRN